MLDPPGQAVAMGDVIDAHPRGRPGLGRARSASTTSSPMGVPEKGDTAPFVALLGDAPTDPARDGVNETIESFRDLLARGLVKPESAT